MPQPQTKTSHDWTARLKGRFIVFDGPDGSGKTTQFKRFVEFIRRQQIEVCEVREPGGTPIGEQIRKVLLDPANDEMDTRAEMLLFMASRAQLVAQRVGPAKAQGHLVLADRFISSTIAYQGAAGGLPVDDILRVGQIALSDNWPDLVVVFDVDEETASVRLAASPKNNRKVEVIEPTLFSDRMEMKGRDRWLIVRQSYLDQAKADPKRYLVLDARGDVDAVFERLCAGLREVMGE